MCVCVYLCVYLCVCLCLCVCVSGTASVALAGVIAAMRITKTKLSEHKYLFQGAGEVCLSLPAFVFLSIGLCVSVYV